MRVAKEKAAESWKNTIQLYEEFLLAVHGTFLGPMISLIKNKLAENPLAQGLIAGQSLHTLTIAEVEDVGSGEGHPYVAVDMFRDGTFECRFVKGAPGKVIIRERCSEDAVEGIVLKLMNMLRKNAINSE